MTRMTRIVRMWQIRTIRVIRPPLRPFAVLAAQEPRVAVRLGVGVLADDALAGAAGGLAGRRRAPHVARREARRAGRAHGRGAEDAEQLGDGDEQQDETHGAGHVRTVSPENWTTCQPIPCAAVPPRPGRTLGDVQTACRAAAARSRPFRPDGKNLSARLDEFAGGSSPQERFGSSRSGGAYFPSRAVVCSTTLPTGCG